MPEPISPTPSQPDGGEGTSGAPDGGQGKNDTVSRTELEAACKSRDAAKEEKRKLEARLKQIESESAERVSALEARLKEIDDARAAADEESARKAGDIDKLQKGWDTQRTELQKKLDDAKVAYAKEVDELKSENASLSKRYYDNLVERALLEELTGISTNAKGVLVFFKSEFEFEAIEDDDGRFQGVKAKGTDKTIAQLHKEVCEKYGLPFEKNDRANGSGAQPPSGGDGGKAPAKLPAGFQTWPKEKQRAWFAEHKDFKMGLPGT